MSIFEIVYAVRHIYFLKQPGSSQKQFQSHRVRNAYQFVSVVATSVCAVNRFAPSKLFNVVTII